VHRGGVAARHVQACYRFPRRSPSGPEVGASGHHRPLHLQVVELLRPAGARPGWLASGIAHRHYPRSSLSSVAALSPTVSAWRSGVNGTPNVRELGMNVLGPCRTRRPLPGAGRPAVAPDAPGRSRDVHGRSPAGSGQGRRLKAGGRRRREEPREGVDVPERCVASAPSSQKERPLDRATEGVERLAKPASARNWPAHAQPGSGSDGVTPFTRTRRWSERDVADAQSYDDPACAVLSDYGSVRQSSDRRPAGTAGESGATTGMPLDSAGPRRSPGVRGPEAPRAGGGRKRSRENAPAGARAGRTHF